MKKTTTDWFLSEFKKQVWFEPNSELDVWMKELIKKAKKRDKIQIKNVFKDGCYHAQKYERINAVIEAEDYYLEKYTNKIPDYFKKFNNK